MFLPGEPQGWWSLVGCRLWGRTESNTTEATQQQQQQYLLSLLCPNGLLRCVNFQVVKLGITCQSWEHRILIGGLAHTLFLLLLMRSVTSKHLNWKGGINEGLRLQGRPASWGWHLRGYAGSTHSGHSHYLVQTAVLLLDGLSHFIKQTVRCAWA